MSGKESSWRTIGSYRLVRRLGKGGMGRVYLGRDADTQQLVAVKVLYKERTTDPRALSRFHREARVTSALRHPNIVSIHDVGFAGSAGHTPFIAMEFVNGLNLQRLSEKPVGIATCSKILVQAASALGAVHAANIIHRDIKPQNLMLGADGNLKLLDFGLAALDSDVLLKAGEQAAPLTRTGAVMGTALYMSPEQLSGDKLTSASDVFSLGIVIYELLTGTHPFSGDSQSSILRAILTQVPLCPSALNPEVPEVLDQVVLRMLDQDPARRPSGEVIEHWVTTRSVIAGPRTGTVRNTRDLRGRFVGRNVERRQILSLLDRSAQGNGSLICIGGEAGIGKTTLVLECIFSRDEFLVARGRCSKEIVTGAYLPILETLDELLRITSPLQIKDRLQSIAPSWHARLVGGRSEPSTTDGPVATALLKREFFNFLAELSNLRPIVLFIDDLHWADESTIDLLAYVAGRCQALAVALVLTYRDEEFKQLQSAFASVQRELRSKGICHEIQVGYLSATDVEWYLAAEYPGDGYSLAFAKLVHERTRGNPLFMTELLLDLRNRGTLIHRDGGWQLSRPIAEIEPHLPESVRAVIESKIERLSQSERDILEAAAVEGIEFDSLILSEVLNLRTELVEQSLLDLERVHGLVAFGRADRFPDGAGTCWYQFLHVLYQEALNPSRAQARRERLSLSIAEALFRHYRGDTKLLTAQAGAAQAAETGSPNDQTGAVAPKLALLFETAGRWLLAIDFYAKAALEALDVSAYREALALAMKGLGLLLYLPGCPRKNLLELQLQMSRGSALMALRTYGDPEAEQAYGRAYELVICLEEAPQYFSVMHSLWASQIMRAAPGMGKSLAEQLIAYAEQRDHSLLVEANFALGFSLVQLGDPKGAAERLQSAVELYRPAVHNRHVSRFFPLNNAVGSLSQLGQSYWYLGFPDRAVAYAREGVELADRLNDPYSQGFSLMYLAGVYQHRREPQRVLECSARAMSITAEKGHGEVFLWSSLRHGWAMAELGDPAGIEQMREGLALTIKKQSRAARPHFLALLADVLLRAGRHEEAWGPVEEALDFIRATGNCGYEAEALRLKAELAWRLGKESPDEAERSALQAVELAHRQSCTGLELRATLTLAAMLRDQDRKDEARTRLERILDGFTEGFGTYDLIAARHFLESLAL